MLNWIWYNILFVVNIAVNWISSRAIWCPILIGVTLTNAWMSVKNNEKSGSMVVPMFLTGLIPLWIIVSSKSKNILFDALLYDSIIAVCYAIPIAILVSRPLSITNWLGVLLLTIGLVLVKI